MSQECHVDQNNMSNLGYQSYVWWRVQANLNWIETVKTSLPPKLSDEELMVRFKNSGNHQYFELLISRYRSKLYSVAFNLLGDAYEAEEIVQEAFIRVWRNYHNFRNNATFAGWIFTIIQNLCKDIWRVRRRKQHYEAIFYNPLSVQEQPDRNSRKAVDEIINAWSEPGAKAETAELRAFITSCLDQLPANQKEVVVLRDLEGHTYKNIASLTGVPIGTVRSRLHYGRQRLKEIIK